MRDTSPPAPWIAALGLLIAVSVAAAQDSPVPCPLTFSITPAKPSFFLVEPKHFTVTLTNRSQQAVEVHRGGDMLHCRLAVRNPAGETLPPIASEGIGFGTYLTVAPGETERLVLDANEFVSFEHPGTHTVDFAEVEYTSQTDKGKAITGAVVSAARCTVELRRAGKAELENLYAHYHRALYSRDAALRRDAVRALRFCALPRRLHLIGRCLRDPDHAVFADAAEALHTSRDPAARLVILNAVATGKRAERVVALMKRFVADEKIESIISVLAVLATRELPLRRAAADSFRAIARKRLIEEYVRETRSTDFRPIQAKLEALTPRDYFAPFWQDMSREERWCVRRFLSGVQPGEDNL